MAQTDCASIEPPIGSANLNGTPNYVVKFTGPTSGGNSQIYDDGTNVGIGTATAATKLHVDGTVKATDFACTDCLGANDMGDGLGVSEIDESAIQRRVGGTCAAGSSIREVAADGTVTCEPDNGFEDHGDLGGREDDDHTQYALLDGRAAGPTLFGGTAAASTLTLGSTAAGAKGKIVFGTSVYDEATDRLGLGVAAPQYRLDLDGFARASEGFRAGNTTLYRDGLIQIFGNTPNDLRFPSDLATLRLCVPIGPPSVTESMTRAASPPRVPRAGRA